MSYRYPRHTTRGPAGDRAHWMRMFEAVIVAQDPSLAGRIDWKTAGYLFDQGRACREAATLCIEAMKADAESDQPYAWGDRLRADEAARRERAGEASFTASMNEG